VAGQKYLCHQPDISAESITIILANLTEKGCSNIQDQKRLISPILTLLKKYELVIIGDREFGSVQLGKWLYDKNVRFVLRILSWAIY